MKKNVYLFAGILLSLAFTTTSCKEDELTPGEMPQNAGLISSGTSLDKDLPEGYRISSVGSTKVRYDEKGRIESIYNGDETIYFESGSFVYSDDEEEVKFSLNSQNLISRITMSYYEGDKYEYAKENGTAIFSYNENNQLSSISINSTWEEYEDGEKWKGSYTDKYTFSYSGKKLKKVVDSWDENEDDYNEKGKFEYTLEYDSDYNNPFFQYTPNVIELVELDGCEVFAYLGLFGRASSKLPTRISYKEISEDGGTEYDNGTIYCGPYRYNSYGALSSADGYSYSYTTVDTRAAGDMWILNPKQDKVRRMFTRPSNRRKNK